MDANSRQDDRSYYQHRAKIEVERAQLATDPCVARTHYDLAEAYLGKLNSNSPSKATAS